MRKETRGCSSTCSGPDLVVALSVPAEIYAWERGAQRFFGQRSEVSLGAPPIVRAAHLSNSELVAQCSPSEPDRSFQLLFCFLSGWSFLLPAALVLMLCILAAVKVNEIGNIQLGCNTSVLQLRSDEQKSWDPPWRCFSLIARDGTRSYDFAVINDSEVVRCFLGLQSAVRGAKGYSVAALKEQIVAMKQAAGVALSKKPKPRRAQSARVLSSVSRVASSDEVAATDTVDTALPKEQELVDLRAALVAETALREQVQAENIQLKAVIEQMHTQQLGKVAPSSVALDAEQQQQQQSAQEEDV